LEVTVLVADPQRLLRTEMFFGFTGHVKCPVYRPSPRFCNVPINAPVDVT
jgi:hypothetical protein